MLYLLDTNTAIGLMAGHDRIKGNVRAVGPGAVLLSSIVYYELAFGAFNSERVQENLNRLADLAFPIIDFDQGDARAAGEIRARLKKAGTPIGPYDVLIAGQALARNLTVVTANRREFDRVDGLAVEDWTNAA